MKTTFLVSDDTPDGYRLEEILRIIRNDIIVRSQRTAEDGRPEAEHVLANNTRILPLLTQAIEIAEDSTAVLARSFGQDQAAHGLPPDADATTGADD